MSSYTMEDIEMIRRKSGISYQEAVALLDYHNGNVARALIDLERNGKIRTEEETTSRAQSNPTARKAVSILQRLYRVRVKLHKGSVPILNLSVLAAGVVLIISPWLVIGAIAVALILGYRISFDKDDPSFAGANLERMVRNAAQNAKNTVSDMAKGFTDAMNHDSEKAAPQEPKKSYYQDSPTAAAPVRPNPVNTGVPTIQMPVKVESQDGSVSIEREMDGFSSATIE